MKTSPRRQQPPAPPLSSLWIALVLVLGTFLVYVPCLTGGWIWDDDFNYPGNPLLHDPNRLWKIWFQPGCLIEYYPIVHSFAVLEWSLWGNNTVGYHVVNILLHLLNALLVWRLFMQLKVPFAGFGALLFAFHPMQVESVAWISELKNTLSLPTFLLAMSFTIHFFEKRRRSDYFCALGFFLLAMLSKITMAPYPVIILLYLYWKHQRLTVRDFFLVVPFLLISLSFVFLTIYGIHSFARGHAEALVLTSWSDRLALAGQTLVFYFSRTVLPITPLPVYPQWEIDSTSLFSYWPHVFLVLILALAVWKRATWGRHLLFGLGFFFLGLLPFCGLRPISYMDFTWVMDHFLYFALIGPIGLFLGALADLGAKSFWIKKLTPYGMGLILALFLFLSSIYAAQYKSAESLWTYTQQNNPGSWIAYQNLAPFYKDEGDFDRAIRFYKISLALKPDNADAYHEWAEILSSQGDVPTSMALERKALEIDPYYMDARLNLANALIGQGQLADAIGQYQLALHYNPDFAPAHTFLAIAYLKNKNIPAAMEQLKISLELEPDNVQNQEILKKVEAMQTPPPS